LGFVKYITAPASAKAISVIRAWVRGTPHSDIERNLRLNAEQRALRKPVAERGCAALPSAFK
jgi:hypothetical protein